MGHIFFIILKFMIFVCLDIDYSGVLLLLQSEDDNFVGSVCFSELAALNFYSQCLKEADTTL